MRVGDFVLGSPPCQLGETHGTHVGRLWGCNRTEGRIHGAPQGSRLLRMDVRFVRGIVLLWWCLVLRLRVMVKLLRLLLMVMGVLIDMHGIALEIDVHEAAVRMASYRGLAQPRVAENLGGSRSLLRHNVQHVSE